MLICPFCGKSDFKKQFGLTNHVKSCAKKITLNDDDNSQAELDALEYIKESPLVFEEGYRFKDGWGIKHTSECRNYELYFSDQVDGIEIEPAWLAVRLKPVGIVVGRHTSRAEAHRSCIEDLLKRKSQRELTSSSPSRKRI